MKVPGQVEGCGICELNVSLSQQEGKVIFENEHWMVFHVDPAPLAGWLMFHAQRHLHSPASMTAAERASFGPTIGHVMELLEQATGCERIYMTAFGESFPHLHAHLIPRYPDRPETHAWAIADHYRACNAPGGTFADAAECEAITAKMKALIASNPPPPIATASKL